MQDHPRLIQGGMGIGISNWRLARAVSQAGHLGVVSGTGIWLVMVRTLQIGDPGGHIRRALDHFPVPSIAAKILQRYFIRGGKPPQAPFKNPPMLEHPLKTVLSELLVAASFVEVWLARDGHDGVVGVNYLEKIQLSLLPSLYGAMLAGVHFVLIGAGIPTQVAGALDQMADHRVGSYRLHVEGAGPDDVYEAKFDPQSIPLEEPRQPLRRPQFLPIISSHVLAQVLLKRSNGEIAGFVVEGSAAGGHNAPPRNRKDLTPEGEPVYTEQDEADLAKMKSLGKPFWLAGSWAGPDSLRSALAAGANGIQVGTLFALCRESGLDPGLKKDALSRAKSGSLRVLTNPLSSPSGYPFKEAQLPGTLTDPEVSSRRRLICDLGCLRAIYVRPDGALGYRCPAEPPERFIAKGGSPDAIAGKRCIRNTLCSTIGLGQVRHNWGYTEPALLTLGSDLRFLSHLANPEDYTAQDAIDYLTQGSRSV